MDGNQFDALSRSLATVGTRRAVTRLLGALPLVGVLVTTFVGEPAGAARHHSRKRRQDHDRHRHRSHEHQPVHAQKKHHKKRGKHRKRQPASPLPSSPLSPLSPPTTAGCKPESAALTCAGRCGQVLNNCETLVDCGSCACAAACPICQTCNTTTGRCETNPAFLGQTCAAPGQVCQADGACTCDNGSCSFGQRCNGLACICDEISCSRPGHFCQADGACICDSESCPAGQRCKRSVCICDATSCPAGCCDGDGICQLGTGDDACGPAGHACQSCTSLGQRCGGGGALRTCGCANDATTCTGKCGSVANNCGRMVECTELCAGCCTLDGRCLPGTADTACGVDGETCFGCDAPDTCFEAACCTQTTCQALYDEMCRLPDDCERGICGTFPDTCGGLDCGPCDHPCFACVNNKCTFRTGSEVCGNNCCTNSCCFNRNDGTCGAPRRCHGGVGDCCPEGYECCDADDGSFHSSCFRATQCGIGGVGCCPAGNICCGNEFCCTTGSFCPGTTTCHFDGAVSGAGCCR